VLVSVNCKVNYIEYSLREELCNWVSINICLLLTIISF